MSMVISGDNGLTFPAGSTQVQAGNYQTMVNRIINGRMEIAQRGTSALTQNASDYQYPVDRFGIYGTVTSKFTAQQSSTAPAGFINSIVCTSSSAYSVLTGDSFVLQQFIEGLNVADFGWGTANAKTVTLSFWVRSSLTGTFGGAFSNSAVNRSYPFTYTISAADTWEFKTITVAGDTSGTWLTTNGLGIRLWFNLGAGSTFSGTAGAWAGADYRSATGATSVVGTNGATFYITGVDLRVGSYTVVPQDFRAYGTELALCQRYYEQIVVGSGGGYAAGGSLFTNVCRMMLQFSVPKRATPSIGFSAASTFNVQINGGNSAVSSLSVSGTTSVTSTYIFANGTYTQNQPCVLIDTGSSFIQVSSEL